MLFIFCSDGEMNLSDVYRECQKDSWVPLLSYECDNVTILPAFSNADTAKSFVKRNVPKNEMWGAISMSEKDVEKMGEKGWKVESMTFPRKLKDRYILEPVIFGLAQRPEINVFSK